MRSFTVVAFLALAFCVLIAEVKSAGNILDEINPTLTELSEKANKELKVAKEKLGELETKAENIAHALGPEGDKLMAKIKAFGKNFLKKTVDWVKAKFSHKAPNATPNAPPPPASRV